jgi:2-haloacid dehalogenase
MKYELVLLDADGTLFDYDAAEDYALHMAFNEGGLPFGPGTMEAYRAINSQLWLDMEQGKTTSAALRVERFRLLFGRSGIAWDARAMSDIYVKHLGAAAFLVDGAEETCAYLASKYRVAIITNGIRDVQLKRIAKSPIKPFIHHIIVSEDAGSQKPDTRIFEYLFAVVGQKDKSTTLIVGDSLSSDIKGGENFGIDTCWYNPEGKPLPVTAAPTYQIRSLRELLSML